MGKSATAQMFREAGVPVYDADAAVVRLYAGRAVPLIEAAFPGATSGGQVDRAALWRHVLDRPEALAELERIVHPLVRQEENAFRSAALGAARPIIVLDIPLLFETGGDRRCDIVLVVSADAAIQRARVLQRPGMTAEKFEAVLAKQVPDADKRRRAHVVIDTGRGFPAARAQVADVLRALAGH
jgi:dephospho-CoA kinase